MHHFTLSKREWVNRFAVQLLRTVRSGLTLDQALALGRARYEESFDASPESAAYRTLGGPLEEHTESEAAWLTTALLHRVAAAPSGSVVPRRGAGAGGAGR